MTGSYRPLLAGGAALRAVWSLIIGIAGPGTGQPSAGNAPRIPQPTR